MKIILMELEKFYVDQMSFLNVLGGKIWKAVMGENSKNVSFVT